VDTTNSQKKSPRNSAKNERNNLDMPQPPAPVTPLDFEQYLDRSFDLVARVRAAKEAAQRKMEEFGDVSEYDVTIIYGQKKESHPDDYAEGSEAHQSSFEFRAQDGNILPPEDK
jgi:hypothetical protein